VSAVEQPEVAIQVNELWKVFGAEGSKVRAMVDSGADREEIKEATDGVAAVCDVSFAVAPGETFVVMGLSGSGKSTLIRCLARLIEPSLGTVEICGQEVLSLDDEELRDFRRLRMAMVFQHFGLFPHRTVSDNVTYGLEVQGVSKSERRERAEALLNTVGLQGWGDHYPQQLSGGMQQRVGLARALAVDPDVLCFDEPFSALDPLIRRDMQDELMELQARQQRTSIFITHDFDEALKLADRIAIMRDGAFEQVGTAAEILLNPATEYVRAFTQSAPMEKVLTVEDCLSLVTSAASADSGASDLAEVPPEVPLDGSKAVSLSTKLEVAIPRLLASPEPLFVVDDVGEAVGLLRHADVAALLEN